MSRAITYLIGCIALMLVSACLDPFVFEKIDLDEAIVIDGQLTDTDGPHIVRLSNVLGFGDKFFDPVEGARVSLHEGEKEYAYVETSPGVHTISKGIITGQPGVSYWISVIMPNGDIVESKPEVLPESLAFTEVNAVFKRELTVNKFGIAKRDRIIEVSINADFTSFDEQENFFLRYGVQEDHSYPEPSCGGLHQPKSCYISETVLNNDFALFDSRTSSKSTIDSLVLYKKQELTNVDFRGKHYFTAFQYSITEEAFEYWLRVKEVTNQQGTVFDKPPAAVYGNFINLTDPNNQVLGYFELASIDLKRTAILRSEYFEGATDQDECGQFNRRNWPDRCCQCLLIDKATTDRPSWF